MVTRTPRDIETVIDDVARAMTAGEPSNALRAEVLRRMATPARGMLGPRAWGLAAVAAAALVIVAGVWVAGPPRSPAPSRAGHEPDAITAPTGSLRRAPAATGGVRMAAGRGERAVRPESSDGPVAAVDIRPLAIAPLSASGVEVEAMGAPEGLDVTPIAVAPLAISRVTSDQVE